MGFFSKDIETMDDLFVHTLRDIYYAEQQQALPKMIEKTTNPQLRAGFEHHLAETRNHVRRVERVFEMDGVGRSTVSCPAIDGIITEANEVAGEVDDLRRMHRVAECVEKRTDAQRNVRPELDHVGRGNLHELRERAVFVQTATVVFYVTVAHALHIGNRQVATSHGRVCAEWVVCATEGYTARLDTIQAIVLLRKLAELDAWNAQRTEIASHYLRALCEVGDLELPPVAPGSEPVWHLFVVRTANPVALGTFLRERGIGTGRHYPQPVHLTGAYRSLGYEPGTFPLAERHAERVLSLPIFPGMSIEQADAVVTATRTFFERA